MYRSKNDYEAAEPLFRRANAIYEQRLDPDDVDFGYFLNNYASFLDAVGKSAEALMAIQRCVHIFEAEFGPKDQKTQIACGWMHHLEAKVGTHK